jgi:hypothetical protein
METNQKYNYIRDIQMGTEGESVPLMPGVVRPMLPPLELREAPATENSDQPEK